MTILLKKGQLLLDEQNDHFEALKKTMASTHVLSPKFHQTLSYSRDI